MIVKMKNTTYHRAVLNFRKPLLILAQCCSGPGGQTNQTFRGPTFLERTYAVLYKELKQDNAMRRLGMRDFNDPPPQHF